MDSDAHADEAHDVVLQPDPSVPLEEIQGARVKGRVTSTKIWICEYPYRTMRRHGPSEDCTDCPVYNRMQQEKEREKQDDLAAHPTV